MNWIRLAIYAAIATALIAAGLAVRTHFVSVGEASVQKRWDAQKRIDLDVSLALEREASAERLRKLNNSERNADEQARLETLRKGRDAATAAELGRMRATIGRLNSRELPSPTDAAGVAALALEAGTARELLGQCAARYRDVAAAADELRDQVIGLQVDAQNVCRGAGAPQEGRDGN